MLSRIVGSANGAANSAGASGGGTTRQERILERKEKEEDRKREEALRNTRKTFSEKGCKGVTLTFVKEHTNLITRVFF